MNTKLIALALVVALSANACAQAERKIRDKSSGNFSLGTRNTLSLFNDDVALGKGVGGQFRLQVNDRINTEWYLDYITSHKSTYTFRNDYHIGWSVMYYMGRQVQFSHLLQPYFIVGHCFDYTEIAEQANKQNKAHFTSMATQVGMGTHINITPRLDCSLSGQYMLHFGKEIETAVVSDTVVISKSEFSHPDGHLLFTLSFNYKWADLWN
jgi:Outer membrane protein beta-barrel domain